MKRVVAGGVVVLVAVVLVGADALWRGTSATIERELEKRETSSSDGAGEPAQLPDAVARHFAHVMPPGQRPIRTARLKQEGEFILNGAWKPMTAEQMFTTSPPAFIWDARIGMAPFVRVYVRDAYLAHKASMLGRVMALYPVANQSGTTALNAGALMRYLGEAVWLPTRLMPGNGLSWEAVDADSARATLTDGSTTVSLLFRFNADGDIVELSSPDRFREVNGAYVKTPWRVRALGYEVRQGIRLMSPAVAEWILPEGPQPYWTARITSATYAY